MLMFESPIACDTGHWSPVTITIPVLLTGDCARGRRRSRVWQGEIAMEKSKSNKACAPASLDRRRFGASIVTGAALAALPRAALAQTWPAGRVTVIVPFPAGAATDITGRIIAERLAQLWGQPVVIDNKGGGNGIAAAEIVARARPDGLTIFATSAMTQAVNPAIYDKLPYDPVESFEAITRMGTSPFVLLVDRDRKSVV